MRKALLSLLLAVPASAAQDRFGVQEIYPAAPGGKNWVSRWDDGVARTMGSGQSDPRDPWFRSRGNATYAIDGAGSLTVSGSGPRMYIFDPDRQQSWRNVEMTVYGMRVSDAGTPWGGIVGVARANHGVVGGSELVNPCDSRGNGARYRYDGHVDFEKETKHPSAVAARNKPFWAGGMPYNKWIGFKLVVYDLANGNVKLESWYDDSDGAGGGNWVKINELEDNGANFGVGGPPCAPGIDPALRLTASDNRLGSPSGKPNIAVYFRTDNVNAGGLVYKKMSVREVSPPGSAAPPAPNLASNRLLRASSSLGLGASPDLANDADPATAWSAAAGASRWLLADLGIVHQVTGAVLTWTSAFASQYSVETSTDDVTWTQAYATAAGAGGREPVAFPAAAARFLRLVASARAGQDRVGVSELEVHGTAPSGADVTPPLITGIQATITASAPEGALRVAWETDTPADTRLDYGASPFYGSSLVDPALTTRHSVTVPSLPLGSVYHYRVGSLDAFGNLARSGDQLATIVPATPGLTDADARAPQKFLSPALADGVNDAAVFGPAALEVTIMDLRGRRVFRAGGPGIVWDGRDGTGRIVESGVYLARVKRTDGRVFYQGLAIAK